MHKNTCKVCLNKTQDELNQDGACQDCSCARCGKRIATHGIDNGDLGYCIDCYSALQDWIYESVKDRQGE
jgi:hypothetical protein